MIIRELVDPSNFNPAATLPYELRLKDFEIAMQDIYDFFFDVNLQLTGKGLERLDETLRPANMSGTISDMLTASLAKHSRALTANKYHNGHPDLIKNGIYSGNSVKAGTEGVEVKTTRNPHAAVDTHGGRDQYQCVFVYEVDNLTEPAVSRRAMRFSAVYLTQVLATDFRTNERGALGTKTSTLGRAGVRKLRDAWVYRL